jgi:predicted dinucleotide-binding enzyme
MRITVFGKGNLGGGLAGVWERAGRSRTLPARNRSST